MLNLLASLNRELADWVNLYKVMARYLLASHRHLLQVRCSVHHLYALLTTETMLCGFVSTASSDLHLFIFHLAQTKTLCLSQGAQDIVESHCPTLREHTGLENLSLQLGLLAAENFAPDYVTLAYCPVLLCGLGDTTPLD